MYVRAAAPAAFWRRRTRRRQLLCALLAPPHSQAAAALRPAGAAALAGGSCSAACWRRRFGSISEGPALLLKGPLQVNAFVSADVVDDGCTKIFSAWPVGAARYAAFVMDVRLLTDTIVRQTTVLLAQVATAAGVRAPLAHVANQVFLELAQELEAQGVRRKVVADMFGLALRSYELKMRRLLETPEVQRSAWRALYARLEQQSRTRLQLSRAFPQMSSRDLAALLNDLVDSGLVYRSGTGSGAVYGVTPEVDMLRREAEGEVQTLANLLWMMLATQGDQDRDQLKAHFRTDPERFDAALQELVASRRVCVRTERDRSVYEAQSFHIPVGAEQGWEAAVCDHFGAVATAIASKLSSPQSRADDTVGGATLRFTVYPDHPLYEDVRGLLGRVRSEVNELWSRVHEHNRKHPPPDEAQKVTFYFGQTAPASE